MKFTGKGKRKVDVFIAELKAKRKEILDAGKDTADETVLPDAADILDDIEWSVDENGEYCTTWGCTDNADLPIFLKAGEDFVDDEEKRR